MAKRSLKKFHGGIFPNYHKELNSRYPITLTSIPKELVLPLIQHIGVEVEPLVKVGDKILKNQKIADTEDDNLHSPIHAPTSGIIKAIEKRQLPHVSGLGGLCMIIKTDGLDTEFNNPLQLDRTEPTSPLLLKDIIYKAGIVGMGGAGFPTFAKLPNKKGKIKTLIINGAECEPFITCDDLLMQNYSAQIISGANIVANALDCQQIICGIEDNKQQAIKKMRQAVDNDKITIKPIPTIYPIGGEKQLIKELLDIEIPAGSHALNSGILVMNVSTVRAIHQAVINGKPLTSRLVTISGLGVNKPYNTEAMLGTAFNDLVKIANPKTELNYPLIQGGPMMGFEVPNNQVPIIKTTNCILANPPEQKAATMPCIRCGECMDACPINLLPQQLYWYSRSHEFEKTEKLNLFDCIECGCCSFVCPSNIPLVQYYRFAKSSVRKQKTDQEATDLAKLRHENRQAREEKLKAEKTARLKAKKDALKQKAIKSKADKANGTENQTLVNKPLSARDHALAAAAKRKADTASKTIHDDKLSPREAALKAAQKRKSIKTEESPNKRNIDEKSPKQTSEAATKKYNKTSKKDPRQSAVDAARKRSELKKVKKQPENISTKGPLVAAVKAARNRAKLKKTQPKETKT